MKRLALLALATVGCGGTMHGSALPERPVGEDLPALLPAGADGIVDIDVTQLGNWSDARRILQLMPQAGKERIAQLGADPLSDVDALAVAIVKPGTPEAEATIVARGKLDFARLRSSISDGNEVDYHGASIYESGKATAPARPWRG